MGQTVYADVLFLINFSMDFLVFYICAVLAGRRVEPLRSALASAIGGVYGVISLFIEREGAKVWLFDVLSLVLICTVAFASKDLNIRAFSGRCILFASVSAVIGGIMTAISSALERSGLSSLEYEDGDDISVWLFALIAAAGGAAAFVGGKRMKRLAISKPADLIIEYEGKSVCVRAMTDTGNMLTDPLSGRAVAMCELDALSNLFSEEMFGYWKNGELATKIAPGCISRIRFIPAKGVLSAKSSLIAAFVPDSVTVVTNKEKRAVDILIAPLTHNLSAGESKALLPPGLVE